MTFEQFNPYDLEEIADFNENPDKYIKRFEEKRLKEQRPTRRTPPTMGILKQSGDPKINTDKEIKIQS